MDKKRPQLNPDELLQLKWLLGAVLALVALSTVFYMDIEAWTLTGLAATAAIATLVRPTLPARVPALVHTLAFPVIVTLFALDLWLYTEVLPAMVRLDIMLLLYRMLGYRKRRDDLQIIILGLFLIIVAGVITVSLLFAVQLLAYTACALAFLLVVTLTEGAQRASAGEAEPDKTAPAVAINAVPAWARHADWGHLFSRLRAVADWRVLGLGTVLFAGVVAVSALLFMAIPRFQLENSMFLDRFMSKKSRSGFSDTIRFGDVTEIMQDNSVALSVDVSDTSQIPALPYWRMFVLDEYREGTFKLSLTLRRDAFGGPRTTSQVPGAARSRAGTPVYWTFYLESGISRYLPLLGPYEMLRFMEPQNVSRATDLNVVALRDDPVSMTAYRVEGFSPGAPLPDAKLAARLSGPLEGPPSRNPLQNRLYLNETDQALLTRLVAEITGGATQLAAADFATRVGEWLRRHHGYTLAPDTGVGDGDPLVRWLASNEAGHCELFAGAFVVLARSAGYSARVVTGFKGGTWNGYSNSFTIRNSDAHAWAEIFDPTTGAWLFTDPLEAGAAQATENRGEAALVQRTDRSWSARFDSLRVFWYRRIVNFDQRTQLETLRSVKEATQSAGKRFRETLDALAASIRAWFAGPWDTRQIAQTGGGLAALAALIWGFRRLRGALAGLRMRRGGHDDPLRREAGRLLTRVRDLEVAVAGALPALVPVTEELQRIRFGARETWSEPEQVLQRARRVLKLARRNGVR